MVVDGTTEREVAVTTGIVAGGWIEASASIRKLLGGPVGLGVAEP